MMATLSFTELRVQAKILLIDGFQAEQANHGVIFECPLLASLELLR